MAAADHAIEASRAVRISEMSGMGAGGATIDPDVVAAIAIAVHEAWPKPAAVTPPVEPNTSWRFGQRNWRHRQVPRRTWGR